jgi:hypothetical protein
MMARYDPVCRGLTQDLKEWQQNIKSGMWPHLAPRDNSASRVLEVYGATQSFQECL